MTRRHVYTAFYSSTRFIERLLRIRDNCADVLRSMGLSAGHTHISIRKDGVLFIEDNSLLTTYVYLYDSGGRTIDIWHISDQRYADAHKTGLLWPPIEGRSEWNRET